MRKTIILFWLFLLIIVNYLPRQALPLEQTAPDLTLIPISVVSSFGRSLAMGDVNGDGYDDLVIGAPKYDEIGDNPLGGDVLVIYGRQSFPDTFHVELEAQGVSFLVGEKGVDFGRVLCCADYNGDEYDDLIIGAPLSGIIDRPKSGKVFCIDGRASYFPDLWELKETRPDWTIMGKDSDHEFGRALDVGDFTGDGRPDLIVGAPHARWPDSVATLSGAAFIIPGRASHSLVEDMVAPLVTPITIYGIHENDLFGYAVKAYDMNNDEISDLLLGAYKANAFVRDEGEAYSLFGGNNLPSMDIYLSEMGATVKFQGGAYQEQLAYALTVGDFDGDDWGDVVLGSRQSDNGNIVLAGQLRINFKGANLPSIMDYRSVAPDVDILGEKIGGMLGEVFAVGDVNADGYDDLIAGAPFRSGTPDTGRAYIFLGGSDMLSYWDLTQRSADVMLIGSESQDFYGSALACGDLNGDGLDDVAIGAWGASPNGKVYVLFGSKETVVEKKSENRPASFLLIQNFPNPFNAGTLISYRIPQTSHVVLTIYTLLGDEVIRLVDENQSAGIHRVQWNAKNALDEPLASGIYLYKIQAVSASAKYTQTRKMSLIK